MTEPRYSRGAKGMVMECPGKMSPSVTHIADRSSQPATFRCDACERSAPIAEVVTSAVLPCSLFCSVACRNEAELAAENARFV
jgi:hypothetical protein